MTRTADELRGQYVYGDVLRPELVRMIPADGRIIGSIGCGTGISEQALVQSGREVHGVDISAPAIELARTRLTSARVVNPDERFPFAERSLDGLILADVIEHIPRAWDVLADYARMVRVGGWVLISVPNMRHWMTIYHFFLRGDWPEMDSGIYDRTHLQVMTRKRLIRWCESAGLEIERWFSRYDPLPKFSRITRTIDLLTLGLFHNWFMFQLQLIARVRPTK